MTRHWAVLTLMTTFLVAGDHQVSAAEPKVTKEAWEGTLNIGPTSKLALVFHVTRTDDGKATATMDSPDQGASGLAAKSVTVDKEKITFNLPDLNAAYEGKLNANGDEAVGTFTQNGAKVPLTLKRRIEAAVAVVAGKEQLWEGKLSVGAGLQLRLVFHILKDDAGKYTATMDSPDQGAKGIKIDSVAMDRTTVKFELKALASKYEGKLDASGTESVGEWSQAGNNLPLTIKLVSKPSEAKRPQTPKAPFPYKSESVSYPNKAGGVTLAGTLTIPSGKGPFPAVLLISGSGSQDRDETLFEHKPFMVLADTLTRRGVAVLRVDDRGVGGSTGSPAKATTDDFAGDVLAGVTYLKGRSEVNGKKIGLIGHSEGGVIAPIVATRSKDVAFIVLMAGTGLPGEDIIALQGRLIARAMGAQDKALDWNAKVQKKLVQIVKSEPDSAKAREKMKASVKELLSELPESRKKAVEGMEQQIDVQIKMLESPWFRHFLTFDPRPTLARVKCPVLAIVGEKDLQVPPKENLSEIEKALKKGGNTKVTVKELPGLNHLFQTSTTGAPSEYATIEETLSPLALKEMGDWVVAQAKK